MIRHPAAYVESIKRKNWASISMIEGIYNQPSLISDLLNHLKSEYEYYLNRSNDIDVIDRACLLWKSYYSVVLKYREKHSDEWLFIKHEEISQDPIKVFKNVFMKLGLRFTRKVQEIIWDHSKPTNPSNAKKIFSTKIDSLSNIDKWKRRLSKGEISRIREQVYKISQEFYSASEW